MLGKGKAAAGRTAAGLEDGPQRPWCKALFAVAKGARTPIAIFSLAVRGISSAIVEVKHSEATAAAFGKPSENRLMLTYDFRLPPGPRTVECAILAEELGFRAVWCPEVPAFGHDIWITLARIAERTKRIKIGPSVLIPSYRHPVTQASAIATLEHIAPGRLMLGSAPASRGVLGWARSR